MCLICISVVVSLITILTNCWFSLSKRPFMTMVQVKTLFSVLFYSEVSDFDWAIKVFLCISSMHMVGCKHQFEQTRHGLLSPQDPSLGSHTITDLFFFFTVSVAESKLIPPNYTFLKAQESRCPSFIFLNRGFVSAFPQRPAGNIENKYFTIQWATCSSLPQRAFFFFFFFFGGWREWYLSQGWRISRNLRLENPN